MPSFKIIKNHSLMNKEVNFQKSDFKIHVIYSCILESD